MSQKGVGSGLRDSCWRSLLRLSEAVRKCAEPVGFGSFSFGGREEVSLNSLLEPHPGSYTIAVALGIGRRFLGSRKDLPQFCVEDFIRVLSRNGGSIPEEAGALVRSYLPYCFGSVYARKRGRSFAVAHLAQSLDGRIATPAGDSNWIGSPGNLVHAHRMRALSDAVLIGSRTLKRDRPQLTVRHVQGNNPRRIILGSGFDGIERLSPSELNPVLFLGAENGLHAEGLRCLDLPRVKGFIPTPSILDALYRLGIFSVFIEGGGITVSRFLEEKTIDILQLHISTMIIGSGISSFSLPAVRDISSSLHFQSHIYVPVDDGVMLIAVPGQTRKEEVGFEDRKSLLARS